MFNIGHDLATQKKCDRPKCISLKLYHALLTEQETISCWPQVTSRVRSLSHQIL